MPFAHPIWLVALILIPILGVGAVLMSRRLRQKWDQLVARRLRRTLIKSSNPVPRWLAFAFLLAAIALIIIGMARPRGEGGTTVEKTKGRNLLLALDLSNSMRTDDVHPDRLALAKLVIYELLEAMPTDRIGLIGFAGEAHLYAPLTIDHDAVRSMVQEMDEEWPSLQGSDLEAAVDLGIKTLNETNQQNNAMVILTDGEKHSGNIDSMIEKAREAGVYIIAVGVGTEDGAYIPHPKNPGMRFRDPNGNPVLSRLQSDVLQELARKTQGAFTVAGSGADIPAMVDRARAGLDAFELEGRQRKVYIEFYQWLVLPAILLLIASMIAATRWRGISHTSMATLLVLTLIPPMARAEEATTSPEKKQMERYRKLAEETPFQGRRARFRLGEASAAYRLQEWDRAAEAYSKALLSDSRKVRIAAHHGMGNILFQQGWLRFMEKPYTAQTNSTSSMERFEFMVRAKLEQLKRRELGKEPEPGEFDYESIKDAILDWTDSARHFQSVLSIDSNNEGAQQNLEVTTTYLRRLKELLEEDEKRTEEAIPDVLQVPESGDGEPQERSEDAEGGGGEQDPPENEGDGDGNEREGEGESSDGEPDGREPQDPGPSRAEKDIPDHSDNVRPGESPDERARRILRDSSDLEKGPISPGQFRLRQPEKNW
ncbi:MAG: VWA domain-containing protein [Akkermansiaceae bacterium]|nr:VWA domain-containing protein [Akkermansiaceae bacterium]